MGFIYLHAPAMAAISAATVEVAASDAMAARISIEQLLQEIHLNVFCFLYVFHQPVFRLPELYYYCLSH